MFQVKIEKNVYVNVVTSAALMSGSKLYLSNPWYDALDGVVRNLKWTNLPSMSTYPLGKMLLYFILCPLEHELMTFYSKFIFGNY